MSFQDEDLPDLNSTCEKMMAKRELYAYSIRMIRVDEKLFRANVLCTFFFFLRTIL